MLLTVVSFLVVIGVIVTLHEFGHFLAARLSGMRVTKFSIGFPPKIWSRNFGQTEFQVCWIPLGGFVHIAGMVDESLDDTVTGAPDEFMSKNPLQKIFTLSAGVMMNYLTAFVLIAILTVSVGVPDPQGTAVGEVMAGMPALKAGVVKDDVIETVEGRAVGSWEDVVQAITAARDTVNIGIRRASGEHVEFAIPTQIIPGSDPPRHVVGIAPKVVFRPASPGEAISQGGLFCWRTSVGIVRFVGDLFGGASSVKDLAGPLGVAKLSGESAREGGDAFLFFIAYVSVSIGFLNILPFPVLDGGHIVYVIIESIIRRPIPSKLKLYIQQAGMAMLLMLVLFVSYQDLLRIFAN
ncbi:site-2 protease family protein [candidate division KSB1 bacterium]|nr:site-2 protease family protein [candidate division KSB1 bacterium]